MADTPNTPNTPNTSSTEGATLVLRLPPERIRGKVGRLAYATLAQDANVPAVFVALSTLSESDRKVFDKLAQDTNPGSKILVADDSFVASKISGLASHVANACKSRDMKVKTLPVLGADDVAYGVRVKRAS